MPSHLIPEQRPDRNGKLVTRHVRPRTGAVGGRTIPAPVSQVESTMAQFAETLPSWSNSEKLLPSLRVIAHANQQLFSAMMRSYLNGTREEQGVWRCVFNEEEAGDEIDEMHYRRMIELVPLSVAIFPDAPPGYRASMVDKHASASEARLAIFPGDGSYSLVKARIIIAEAERKSAPRSGDRSEDIAYISQHLDEVIPLVPELVKRGTASADIIRELLNSDVKAIREGVL